MLSLNYWEKAAAFHGHTCPGLAIGFKAWRGAIAELGLVILSCQPSMRSWYA